MLTTFRRWLFGESLLLHHPFSIDQLGRFASVSGLIWHAYKDQLVAAGYRVVGHAEPQWDRIQVARGAVLQFLGKAVLKLERAPWAVYHLCYRCGFLDTAEGCRYSFRHDFRFAFWRVLQKRRQYFLR